MEKPLFIPLKAECFDAFAEGTKRFEYRPYGPRWNEHTCRPGRKAILSRGYGKARRMEGVIGATVIVPPSDDFRKIYRSNRPCFAIEITQLSVIERD